ncbi:MAG: putative Nudix hydrolase NudL [Cytophagales bacterium]|jgi:8-oxo-dGTP pyrophosphatase MutT (NUDIX family)|nr:CoA pyrophosphatase [Bacteroidota bacterium]MBS1979589.1 CoA pyrophosphatase [Bacteroidota bacterium]WHZ09210.1 MAG: putative Nudix hydrolase NudL [Cytophagales bacterium]
MKLIELADRLQTRLQQPLPGAMAHEMLRATPAGSLIPKFNHASQPRPGSVIILLYEEFGAIRFPLTKRPDYVGAHAGQVSLPGGKTEKNENYIQTALRECEEEIGVPSDHIQVIGKISDFYIAPSNFIISPVVAYSTSPPEFYPQESEVARILNGNLDELLRSDAIHTQEILAAKKYPMIAPHFLIEGEIVWGATAMMLNELRIIVQELNTANNKAF